MEQLRHSTSLLTVFLILGVTSGALAQWSPSVENLGGISAEVVDSRWLLYDVLEAFSGDDLNGDGIVNAFDLAVLLGAWGACE